MPKDKSGKYHMNSQRATAADKMPAKAAPKHEEMGGSDGGGGMDGGEQHIGHQLMQTAADHPSGGIHMHVHKGDDGTITTHHVGHDGEVQGPHQHGDVNALHAHMQEIMGEEGMEPEHQGMEPMMHMGGGHSLHGM